MLGFFKGKSKDNIIYSPCKGKVVPITEVSDPTFSEKVLGDGFAVIPSEGKIYAPADGEISMVFDTLHAVTMTTSQGTELLIHIGLDTVTLKGEPFISHVSGGQQVKKGDLLLEADLEKIKSAESVNASCGSTAYMWYPYGYRLYAVSRNYAGWRYSGCS